MRAAGFRYACVGAAEPRRRGQRARAPSRAPPRRDPRRRRRRALLAALAARAAEALPRVVDGTSLLDATLAARARFAPPRARLGRVRRASTRRRCGATRGSRPRACWWSRCGATRRWRSRWRPRASRRVDPDARARGPAGRPPHPRRARPSRATCARAARAADEARRRWSRSACGRRGPRRATATSSWGAAAGAGYPGLHRVRRFVEKPDAARARRFLRQRRLLWNAGIFVWTARAPSSRRSSATRRSCPRRSRRCARQRTRGGSRGAALAAAYRRRRRCRSTWPCWSGADASGRCPCRFHWSDVGTWASLAEELGVGTSGNVGLGGDAVLEETPRATWSGARSRLVALLGVEGLAVIDTPATPCWWRGWRESGDRSPAGGERLARDAAGGL